MSNTLRRRRSIVALATAYSGAADFKMPKDLDKLSDEQLSATHDEALAAFNETYQNGEVALSGAALATLGTLTENIEALAGKIAERQTLASQNAEAAAALAARVGAPAAAGTEETEQTLGTEVVTPGATVEDAPVIELSAEGEDTFTSEVDGKKVTFRLPKGLGQNAGQVGQELGVAKDMKEVAQVRADGLGFAAGQGVDFNDLGKALDTRLKGFNYTQYSAAAAQGREMRQMGAFAQFKRMIPDTHVIKNDSPEHVGSVVSFATDEKRLPKGSLLASGGWHAPSEVLYNEFLELESRDGILGLPEIGIARGGVHITPGPSFQELYAAISGFHYTEADDIAGNYGPKDSGGDATAGSKPVYHVEPPEFKEYRLDVDGLIITAGLLASRGYPEHLARVIRGALVAHDHRINAAVIASLAAGSTAVGMTAGQVGAAAPLLTAIELQVEHYKTTHRMQRGATLEAVFPFWVRGAIRSDLSRRLGIDLFDVSDARINGWFSDRGVVPSFVYDWQSIDVTAATAFNKWPTSVSFLLYAAGTWVKGVSDVLTLDTLYDSVLLGKNDYTALFTEEGWFTAKAGVDSRLVTTSISATGAANIGAEIQHDGTAAA